MQLQRLGGQRQLEMALQTNFYAAKAVCKTRKVICCKCLFQKSFLPLLYVGIRQQINFL